MHQSLFEIEFSLARRSRGKITDITSADNIIINAKVWKADIKDILKRAEFVWPLDASIDAIQKKQKFFGLFALPDEESIKVTLADYQGFLKIFDEAKLDDRFNAFIRIMKEIPTLCYFPPNLSTAVDQVLHDLKSKPFEELTNQIIAIERMTGFPDLKVYHRLLESVTTYLRNLEDKDMDKKEKNWRVNWSLQYQACLRLVSFRIQYMKVVDMLNSPKHRPMVQTILEVLNFLRNPDWYTEIDSTSGKKLLQNVKAIKAEMNSGNMGGIYDLKSIQDLIGQFQALATEELGQLPATIHLSAIEIDKKSGWTLLKPDEYLQSLKDGEKDYRDNNTLTVKWIKFEEKMEFYDTIFIP